MPTLMVKFLTRILHLQLCKRSGIQILDLSRGHNVANCSTLLRYLYSSCVTLFYVTNFGPRYFVAHFNICK